MFTGARAVGVSSAGTGGVLGGRYHLAHVVGRGASADVWLAWIDGDPTRPVAVKRARPGDGGDALGREASALADVDHPHLVGLIEVVADPPGSALVLPYVAGGTLRDLLDERGTLAATEVAAVLAPVADAVGALHEAGRVHGDLKPENVLLDDHGRPAVADLGRWPDPLALAATPAYLDPVVASGGAPDGAADTFALGVIAYEALTGRRPHRGPAAEVIAAAQVGLHRPLRSWPSVPEGVAAVVEAALDPNPARRPPSATVFGHALLAAAAAARSGSIALPGAARRRRAIPLVGSGADLDTLEFRPAHPPRPSPSRPLLVPAALAACSLAAIGLGVVRGLRPDGDGDADAGPPPGLRCPAVVPARPAPGAGALRWADLDGDGCVEPVWWDGALLRVEAADGSRAYRLEGSGRQLLLGDWDGRDGATPALYDPETGTVRYVDALPAVVGQVVRADRTEGAPRRGRALVAPGSRRGDPDHVRVVPPR